MKKSLLASFCFTAFFASGCASIGQEAQINELLGLTKEHFYNTASLKDSPLDTTATITTVNGFQEKRGLLGIVWDDVFLRAFIDKKSGDTTYQVYQVIYYQAPSWRFYNSVNYETFSGPKSVQVTVIDRNVDCTASRYSGCTYIEHIGFNVDKNLLSAIATQYSPGQKSFWKFKFGAKAGQDYLNGLTPAEVAGFLDRVRTYQDGLKAAD